MKKIFSTIPLLAVTLLLAFATISCSKENKKLLETIPSTVDFVADIDLPDILKGLGAEVSEQEITIPESLKFLNVMLGEDASKHINDCYKALETEHFILFRDSITQNSIVTMNIRDNATLDNIIKDLPCEIKSGFKVCTHSSGVSLVIKDNQFWALKSDKAVEEIKNILTAAKKSNIGQHQGLSEFLERDGCASFISNWDGFGPRNHWSCMNMVVKDSHLIINAQIMSTDGEIIEFEGLQHLQTHFLGYIPPTMNFVAAIGATRTTDWSLLDKIASSCDITQIAGLLDTLLPYLHSADGTVALATTINTDDIMDSGANFFLMIHLPQHKIREGLAEIEQQINNAGGKATRDENGNISLNGGPGMSLYAANIDGYLAIATYPLKPTYNNEFAPYFVNRNAGLYINLPSIPMLPDTPGVDIDLQVQNQSASLSISCPQGLTTLLNILFSFAL